MAKTIKELVMEYFINHPNEDLKHGPVVDWVEEQYKKENNRKPRDTWRTIRGLYQEGRLIKVEKGIYRYDPEKNGFVELQNFSPATKEEIFKRDKYTCVVCGRGRKDGVEIHADHIKPKELGGDNSVDNGQTLCSEHNILKKKYSQIEAGKRYFIKIYEKAVAEKDDRMIKFCECIFKCFDLYRFNSHIKTPKDKAQE